MAKESKKVPWSKIAEKTANKFNEPLSVDTCRNKFNTLKRQYTKVKQLQNRSGAGADGTFGNDDADNQELERSVDEITQSFPYFDLMADLLGENCFTGNSL